MIKTKIKDLPAYQFHLLRKFSDRVIHGVFTRGGGVSEGAFRSLNVRFGIGDADGAVRENRRRIIDGMNVLGKSALNRETDIHAVSANQVHGKNIKVIESVSDFEEFANEEIDFIDGFVTNVPDVALMIQVADCQAILMAVPSKGVIAAIHAGWKGLVHDISGEAIAIMKERFGVDPSEILVGVSPSLGPCCSYFSDPKKELPESFHEFIDEDNRVDLWGYSVNQLKAHGVRENQIEISRICTQCENGRVNSDDRSKAHFYSFRGDRGITGRFGAVIATVKAD